MIVPLILCGGSGTRLWPLSRKLFPKQFHSLSGESSLLQQTASRAGLINDHGPLIVITNEDQKFLVAEQLANVADLHILIEPEAKNTAPAVALSALYVLEALPTSGNGLVLLVMPSDHLIADEELFGSVVGAAHPLAQEGKLVTFGIQPDRPETGYGYIEMGEGVDDSGSAFQVKRFIEKPNLEAAQLFVGTGSHLWNSGIFMFDASAYLQELQQLSPDIYQCCVDAFSGLKKYEQFTTVEPGAFSKCPNISIDYAVMEKTENAVVIPFKGLWSDIGSWTGLADTVRRGRSSGDGDGSGNITVGEVFTKGVSNSYIHATNRLVTAVGIKDSIVVETADAVLVADKQSDQKIKDLVEYLKQEKRKEVEHHTLVYRPWGSYQSLEQGPGFQVKRLIIKPGASISLQLHRRRSEHWVVVKGEAMVTKGTDTFPLQINESTYIPVETVHKLENRGASDLEIIEVQTGEYFGEDDIERFEDKYGRT